MKKVINLFFTALIVVSMTMIWSCSDEFLTKEPPGVAAGSVIQTPEGVEALVIGVYERLGGAGIFGGAMGSDWTYGSAASDDTYKGTSAGDQSNFNLVERYEALPNNPYMRERWRDCYDGVARANVALNFLAETQKGTTPLSAARATEIEAELKFLRAWFHFSANKIFEKIPYIKTEAELGGTKPEQVTNDDAGWDEMEADLQFAIDNLPTTPPNGQKGRTDKYAAMAVKAHAHMYQGEFAAAATLLDGIIGSGAFSLVAQWDWNFDMTHENNSESIFELQATSTATSYSSIMPTGSAFHQKGPASCGGWGFFQPSSDLFDAYQVGADGLPILNVASRARLATDMGKTSGTTFVQTDALIDPRVDWTIARRGIDFLEWGIHPGNDWIREQANGGPFMTKKFMHRKSEQSLNLNGSGFRNGLNYRQYRLAHVLLWRAECALEASTPDLELARSLVNQIRNRAKNSTYVKGLSTKYTNPYDNPVVDWSVNAANYLINPYPGPGVYPFDTKANALMAVRDEMRLEFATEGHRFFDLRRWGIASQVLNAYIAKDVTFRSFMTGAVYNATEDDYWPLPQDQLDLQKGVLQQDPSYK